MAKKLIIICIIVVVIVGGIFIALHLMSGNNGGSTTAPISTQTTDNKTVSLPIVPTVTDFPNAPQGDTFVMDTPQGSVTINNFYNSPLVIDEEFLILENTNDYQITYDTVNNQFFIYASSTPLDAARQKGETAFLQLLGVSKQDACKLNVAEGYPQNSSLARNQPDLSFCASSSAFQAN